MPREKFTVNGRTSQSERDDERFSRRQVLQGLGSGAVVTGLSLGSIGTAAAATSVTGGGDALQTAIDNASDGDVITVGDSKTYNPVTVDVPNLRVDVASGETPIIDGGGGNVAVSIAAGGVTFDGFTVTNQNGLLGVKVQPGYNSVTVSNNTVDGIGPTGDLGVTGIIIGGGSNDNIKILNNTVQNLDQEINEDGGFPTVNGIFADGGSGDTLSNSTIANNTVRDMESDIAPLGIIINCDADTVSINGNEVRGLLAAHRTDSDDTDDASGEFSTFAQGINISSPSTIDVDIVRNDVSDVVSEDGFFGEAIKIDGDASGVTVRRNNLLAALGANNADSDELSAKCNWWGSDDGPDVAPSNLDAEVGDGQSDVVGSVDYEPWLLGPIEDNPSCTGGAPSVSNVSASPNPVAVGNEATVTATIDDSATGNSNLDSVEYSTDGGSTWHPMTASDGSFDSPTEEAEATLGPYDTPEVLTVCVRATDTEGATSPPVCIDVAVYDSDGGFVTGGGWYNSPEGAYKKDESTTGKANFGFVSKYKKGADEPSGNTEFRFRAAGLDFKSDDYDWLVVSGNTAQYKGTGSLKSGSGDYMFKVKATDGNLNSGTTEDAFRIKIVDEEEDEVIYDNGTKTPLRGGNIIVHEG